MATPRFDAIAPRPYAAAKARFAYATLTMVEARRRDGQVDEDIRVDVLTDIKDSFGLPIPTVEIVYIEGDHRPKNCVTCEGLYRLLFEEVRLDPSDTYIQEQAYEWVREAVDGAIAGQASCEGR